MRKRKYSNLFKKKIKNLKGQSAKNLINKRDEILNNKNLDHYKNLKHDLSDYKRVHVSGGSYVILFFGDDNIIYFVDYEHHDKVYNCSKKYLKRFEKLEFE